jgi:hypothetical protein
MSVTRGKRGAVVGLSALALGVGLQVAGAGKASGEPPATPDDGVPSGTIAFFAGGVCPEGWKIADETAGRMVVGVTDGANAGVTVGEPLGDQEDRPHLHPYKSKVTIADKAIAAADGPNTNGAAAKSYDITGSTTKEVTGLPFIQVQACAKP